MRMKTAKPLFRLALCLALFGAIQCPRGRGRGRRGGTTSGIPVDCLAGFSGVGTSSQGQGQGQGQGQRQGQGQGLGAPATDPLAYQRGGSWNSLNNRLQQLDSGQEDRRRVYERPAAASPPVRPQPSPSAVNPFPNAPPYAPRSFFDDLGVMQQGTGNQGPSSSEPPQAYRPGTIAKRFQDLSTGRVPPDHYQSTSATSSKKQRRKSPSPPGAVPPPASQPPPDAGLPETLSYIPTVISMFYANRERNERDDIKHQDLLDILGRMHAIANRDRCAGSPMGEGPSECMRALAEFNQIPETFRGHCADMLRADCREWPNPLTYRCSFYIKTSPELKAPLSGRWYTLQQCIDWVDTNSAQMFLYR